MVVLHERVGNPHLRHILLVVALEEKAALVAEYPGGEYEYSR